MRYSTQRELQQGVTERIRAVETRLRAAIAGLSQAQLAWSPPDGGWGIAQVFEHLCVADEAYLPLLERLVRAPNAPRRDTAEVAWAPRWGGKLLIGALSRPRKVKAPKRFRIGPTVREGVITHFFATIPRGVALMHEADALRWSKVKLGSVAMPLIRMNLGDVFLLGVVHTERHAGQIERVRNHPQFPKA